MRRENPDFSEFTLYDRSSGTTSTTGRVSTDIKTASNNEINYLMVSFADHYNATSLKRLPSKTKIGKGSWYFNNHFYVSLISLQLQRIFFLY